MSETSPIASTQTEQQSVAAKAPMTLKARICLFVSLGMLLVCASLATGLLQGLAQLFYFLASDLVSALPFFGIIAAIVALIYFAANYTDLFATLCIRSVPAVLVAAWWFVSTWTYTDGSRPLAFPIIALTFTSTVLLAVCGALHFDESWGTTKLARLYAAFTFSNFCALIVIAASIGIRLDIEASELRREARQAFAELHGKTEHHVATDFKWDGNQFVCETTPRGAYCDFK